MVFVGTIEEIAAVSPDQTHNHRFELTSRSLPFGSSTGPTDAKET